MRYILFRLFWQASLALVEGSFDTQKLAKDYICQNGEYENNFVLYDTNSYTTQYVYVKKYNDDHNGKLHCTDWDCAKYFVTTYSGFNI